MIRALMSYTKDEVQPRAGEILKGSELWIAAGLGAVLGWYGDRWLVGSIKVDDAVIIVLTYCAIALGFCVAGLTIALTLPDREFAKKLASHKNKASQADAYSDLLFVFSWTAICHWTAILALVVSLAVGGADRVILLAGDTLARRVGVGVVMFIAAYSFGQFLITLITLSQVGKRYIELLRDGGNSPK